MRPAKGLKIADPPNFAAGKLVGRGPLAGEADGYAVAKYEKPRRVMISPWSVRWLLTLVTLVRDRRGLRRSRRPGKERDVLFTRA